MVFVFGITLIIGILSLHPATAYTSSGHISLLTVAEGNSTDGPQGGVADLYLTITPGTGRIFIDSYPLSRIDTQITTRFAAEMACDFLDIDCSHYDFFYTIKANSALVGGPSAGAATTVLTIAMLDNTPIRDKEIVMTGTINSGNLIGPISGTYAKAKAAQDHGFTTVLIPKWDMDNETAKNLSTLSVRIIPVSTISDALYAFTGKDYSQKPATVASDAEYQRYMQDVTRTICTEYGTIDNGTLILPNLSILIKTAPSVTVLQPANNTNATLNITTANATPRKDQFQLALDAIHNQEYYSAASFCFSGNVRITAQHMRNMTNHDLQTAYMELFNNITTFEKSIDTQASHLERISQLETYVIVKERLSDAKKSLTDQSFENLSADQLAYARERFNTAVVWSRFWNLSGATFVLDQESLRTACLKKIGEAEERQNYLNLFFPADTQRDNINAAYAYYDKQDYPLCIFTASKAKADLNVILSALFVSPENLADLTTEKLAAARDVIAVQSRKHVFPISGYSYYEYATTLQSTDPSSALVYAEYSLELSNLNMYFPRPHSLLENIPWSAVWIFVAGVAFGILLVVLAVLFIIPNRHVTGQKTRARKRR